MERLDSGQGGTPDIFQRYEALRNEHQAVKRKLESKNDALLILSRDLAACQGERDQFKLMADQLRNKCQSMKKQLQSDKHPNGSVSLYTDTTVALTSQLEVDDLKQRLADAEGDIKLLREKLVKHRLGTSEQQKYERKSLSADERDDLLEKLENSGIKYDQLEQDMKQVLDLKEELETERDTYKSKYNRLNTELNFIMRGDEKHVVDIDALVMENKYLQQRVKQLVEENSTALHSLKKYKHLVEKRKPTGILKSTTNHVVGGLMISQRQMRQLLATPDETCSASPQVIQELKVLASSLLETVNDKNLALSHQRKSNKLLASRITDLENKIHQMELTGDSTHFRGGFEGWGMLRGDCADIRSLIPSSLNSSELGDEEEHGSHTSDDHSPSPEENTHTTDQLTVEQLSSLDSTSHVEPQQQDNEHLIQCSDDNHSNSSSACSIAQQSDKKRRPVSKHRVSFSDKGLLEYSNQNNKPHEPQGHSLTERSPLLPSQSDMISGKRLVDRPTERDKKTPNTNNSNNTSLI